MFYHIFYPLGERFIAFNVLKYITFRSGCAFLTSFLAMFFFWRFINRLNVFQKFNLGERVDMYGHSRLETLHKDKSGTPTMGGVMIVGSIALSMLLWMRWDVRFIWYCLFIMFTLGGLGLRDDWLKFTSGRGLSRRDKFLYQMIIGVLVGVIVCLNKNMTTEISFPFFKRLMVDLGYFYVLWTSLVIVSTSNAVNFTDGLDGLAIGGVITTSIVFAILCYLSGHILFSGYLFIPYVPDSGELTIVCSAILGAGLGFLWYNCYPAQIFMGDTGALSLGGLIGAIALFIKKEFLLILCGGIFVAEALSVCLQILSVKLKGKRVLDAAPLHHHYQIKGVPESKIIVRFWIFSILLAALALLTLKLR